jgi:hypothetical protein
MNPQLYKGVFNAKSKYPEPIREIGNWYIITVEGEYENKLYNQGDIIIYNGESFDRVPNPLSKVFSVNNLVGNVELTTSHIAEGLNQYYREERVKQVIKNFLHIGEGLNKTESHKGIHIESYHKRATTEELLKLINSYFVSSDTINIEGNRLNVSTINSDKINETSQLFFTQERVIDVINHLIKSSDTIRYNSITNQFEIVPHNINIKQLQGYKADENINHKQVVIQGVDGIEGKGDLSKSFNLSLSSIHENSINAEGLLSIEIDEKGRTKNIKSLSLIDYIYNLLNSQTLKIEVKDGKINIDTTNSPISLHGEVNGRSDNTKITADAVLSVQVDEIDSIKSAIEKTKESVFVRPPKNVNSSGKSGQIAEDREYIYIYTNKWNRLKKDEDFTSRRTQKRDIKKYVEELISKIKEEVIEYVEKPALKLIHSKLYGGSEFIEDGLMYIKNGGLAIESIIDFRDFISARFFVKLTKSANIQLGLTTSIPKPYEVGIQQSSFGFRLLSIEKELLCYSSLKNKSFINTTSINTDIDTELPFVDLLIVKSENELLFYVDDKLVGKTNNYIVKRGLFLYLGSVGESSLIIDNYELKIRRR